MRREEDVVGSAARLQRRNHVTRRVVCAQERPTFQSSPVLDRRCGRCDRCFGRWRQLDSQTVDELPAALLLCAGSTVDIEPAVWSDQLLTISWHPKQIGECGVVHAAAPSKRALVQQRRERILRRVEERRVVETGGMQEAEWTADPIGRHSTALIRRIAIRLGQAIDVKSRPAD